MTQPVRALCDTGFALHKYLRHGHLERVYETGLLHRLRKRGISVQSQHPLIVYDEDGTQLGDYFADLFVEGTLIVEIKACKALADEHVAQILGYMRASKIEHGLLINFGSEKFQIRKFILTVNTPVSGIDDPAIEY